MRVRGGGGWGREGIRLRKGSCERLRQAFRKLSLVTRSFRPEPKTESWLVEGSAVLGSLMHFGALGT